MTTHSRFKERSLANGREKWGNQFTGGALEDFLDRLWSYFKSAVGLGLFGCAVAVLSGALNVIHFLSPPTAGIVGGTSVLLASSVVWKRYWDAKRSAGRSAGLTTRETLKLSIASPEKLSASLDRIRQARHE